MTGPGGPTYLAVLDAGGAKIGPDTQLTGETGGKALAGIRPERLRLRCLAWADSSIRRRESIRFGSPAALHRSMRTAMAQTSARTAMTGTRRLDPEAIRNVRSRGRTTATARSTRVSTWTGDGITTCGGELRRCESRRQTGEARSRATGSMRAATVRRTKRPTRTGTAGMPADRPIPSTLMAWPGIQRPRSDGSSGCSGGLLQRARRGRRRGRPTTAARRPAPPRSASGRSGRRRKARAPGRRPCPGRETRGDWGSSARHRFSRSG